MRYLTDQDLSSVIKAKLKRREKERGNPPAQNADRW
jgi:hypothetical protein